MTIIHGWAALGPKQPLVPFNYDAGPLAPEEVEIAVDYCGLCHSDLSIIHDDWSLSRYPVIPGHEVIGRVVAIGAQVKGIRIGQRVGIGWNAESCMTCRACMTGQHNLCAEVTPTIVGHQGGFAERVRAHWGWTIPLPDGLESTTAGPLMCAGTTVFAPLINFDIKPTDRVGIVGIGGLGHLALKFANAWGCEVWAFTSKASKIAEAKQHGAHHVVVTDDGKAVQKAANSLDFLLITVNITMDWPTLVKTLRTNGRMAIVGAVMEPMPISAIDLIFGQRSVAGSLNGGPVIMSDMLEFAARHRITPTVEHFPMSQVNDALEHLTSGKARYRVVLDADFGA